MFHWDKSINAINIPASKVVHLFRSMREVQLALPGVFAQQASAFLCQYQVDEGVTTVAIFHLHKSKVLSFYFSDPSVVPEQKTDSMLDQGLNFVESMGFLMTDQDIHLLDVADQEMLWASLPIKAGLLDEVPAEIAAKKPEEKPAAKEEMPTTKAAPVEMNEPETTENVDDLLAAVEAMRAKRPGLRVRKPAPSADEMGRRRVLLRETIGRILASL